MMAAPPASPFTLAPLRPSFEAFSIVGVIECLLPLSHPPLTYPAAQDVDGADEQDENQRGGPRQLNLVLERHAREVIDEDGQRCGGLHQVGHPAAEGPV